ncbi:MAG: BrnT family toxin, partial [Rhodocyclales bacterium]|nr:BrnT family toxin [Rhodocyclales bacterium]
VEQLDWSAALIEEDVRKDYGERRYRALGFIGDRLHAVVFTPRADKVHVISLRKANQREVKIYAQNA